MQFAMLAPAQMGFLVDKRVLKDRRTVRKRGGNIDHRCVVHSSMNGEQATLGWDALVSIKISLRHNLDEEGGQRTNSACNGRHEVRQGFAPYPRPALRHQRQCREQHKRGGDHRQMQQCFDHG